MQNKGDKLRDTEAGDEEQKEGQMWGFLFFRSINDNRNNY